ncbi:MAG: response regulator [Candidatus Latescibacteria bacterium]|nr:response regulator [Candidatus Latescibacterota bacterium]
MKTILIVDDEPYIRMLYERELAEEGYHARAVATGSEALQMLERDPVDVVVLDVRLAEQEPNGLTILNEILARKRDQKIILNTAYPSYMDEGASWLANGFVVKSSDLTELKARIREVLSEG